MSFSNKVVLITGASSGIGAATAISFAAEGAKVAIVARNQTKLNDVADKCASRGARPLIIVADVSKDDDAKSIIKKTIDHYGQLDVLVNNAGILRWKRIDDETILETFDEVMNTNLRAVVHLTSLAAPHIIKTKGNIVNVSSIASLIAFGNTFAPYCISKAGMDHFTRCAALELADSGVRVNSVNPGPVKTSVFENAGQSDEEFRKVLISKTALGRSSDAEEVADVIMFLASDKAKSITGSIYVTDNGYLLKN